MSESILTFDHGHMEPLTWSDVDAGNIVRDQRDMLHTVQAIDSQYVTLRAVRPPHKEVTMFRPLDSREVDIYVPSESECQTLLDKELGARLLVHVEQREHTLAQIPRFREDPVPRNVEAIKDHASWMHGVELQDQLNQYNLAKKRRPKTAEGRTERQAEMDRAINVMIAAHDDFHENPGLWTMPIPHHHALEATS